MNKIRRGYIKTTRQAAGTKCPSPRAITAQEALSLLESAVSYCQSAGLNVQAQNGTNGTLGLFIPNAQYVLTDGGTRAAFRLHLPLRTVQGSAHPDGIGTSQDVPEL